MDAFFSIAQALGVNASDLYKYGYRESESTKLEPQTPIFGQRLMEFRGDLTLTDFARLLGISRQSLGFYINGSRAPDIHTLRKISEVCDCSSDYLIGLSDVKKTDTDMLKKALNAKKKLHEALQELNDFS